MFTLKRTNSKDEELIALVKLLDADLKIRDGEEHGFYNQFNSIVNLPNCIVGYWDQKTVACGAIKAYDTDTAEIKRMYVLPAFRGQNLASQLLLQLESWAKELGFKKCILETGLKQPEAIALYKKNDYNRIQNYGQYEGVENSVCFEKVL